ncbi:hypothetical protein [uncultured Chryseobacterium sp.]|uniref:hypothetical protein n=1 Tax=uncultured Chryseobacterium sp. TaxID=259322 RepID=UPI0025F7545D|nr:hypothetical protein [uncultured Chryseobacterium sp.]
MFSEKLTEEQLRMIKSIDHNGEKYFNVKEIKEKYPNMKFNIDNILDLQIGRYVRVKDIEPMTQFDIDVKMFKNRK